mmetsp:Transcript_16169/g.51654  ORF Transcript_16169/g.51654 Transcript_16169/m.51654 type:complete len:205 (+) Transcript_16169:518-1132(+)
MGEGRRGVPRPLRPHAQGRANAQRPRGARAKSPRPPLWPACQPDQGSRQHAANRLSAGALQGAPATPHDRRRCRGLHGPQRPAVPPAPEQGLRHRRRLALLAPGGRGRGPAQHALWRQIPGVRPSRRGARSGRGAPGCRRRNLHRRRVQGAGRSRAPAQARVPPEDRSQGPRPHPRQQGDRRRSHHGQEADRGRQLLPQVQRRR